MSSETGKAGRRSFFRKIVSAVGLGRKKKASILILGLDNSGKTTLLKHLKASTSSSKGIEETKEVVPTVGFSVENFEKDSLSFTCFDMSGQSKYRSLWERYYKDVQAIIWVVDATDKFRMCVVEDELTSLLEHDAISGQRFPVLFFANKMDVAGSLEPEDIATKLELHDIDDRPWFISASNALTGEGVSKGIEWLTEQLKKTRDRKNGK
jgi:ADP-ribosylation factor-like protein 6